MRYVWATIGESEREMAEAKAVIVEAEDIEDAKRKVTDHVADTMDDLELISAMADEYGSTWFLQELADEEL
jgi:hypothetical protein